MATLENTTAVFVDNVRRVCIAMGIAPERLASDAELDVDVLEKILAGTLLPSVDELASIARALGVAPADLLEPGTNEKDF